MARETPTWQQTLAMRISEGIVRAGYSSKDHFARSIALPRMTLHKLLKGELDPRISTLIKIADGLDSSLEDLLAKQRGGSPRTSAEGEAGTAMTDLQKPGRRKLKKVSVKITVSGENLPSWLVEGFSQAASEGPTIRGLLPKT